jgi:NADH-quinone oxidoreductase subunit I
MTNFYELAGPTRAGLIYEKQDLLAPMLGGMVEAPHPMVPGTTEQDYYRGAVTEAVPEQKSWADAHTAAEPAEGTPRAGQNTDTATSAADQEARR